MNESIKKMIDMLQEQLQLLSRRAQDVQDAHELVQISDSMANIAAVIFRLGADGDEENPPEGGGEDSEAKWI